MKKFLLCGMVFLSTGAYATPVTFYDALNMALNSLDEIQLAKSIRDNSNIDTKQVIAGQKPSLTATLDASNTFVGDFGNIREQGNASSATLTARWTAYQFGRKALARENAGIDEKNADLEYYKTESSIIKTVVTTYFSLIEVRHQYETQLKSEKNAESAVNKDTINFQNGTLAESVYLNSQAKYARIKANRIALEIQLNNLELEFKRIVGFQAPKNMPIPDLRKIILPETQEIAIQHAITNNADLGKINNTIDKLKNTLVSQQAERKGEITMSGSTRKDVKNGGDLRNTVAVQYQVPFDINTTNKYKVDKTAKDLTHNKIRLRIEQDKIRNAVRNHWQIYIQQKYLLDANKITMQANKVAVETETIMYDNGQSTSAKLLEKIEAEIQANKDYVSGLRQYAIAIVDLLTVMGNMSVDKFSKL